MVHSLMAPKPEDIISPQWNYTNWKFYKNPDIGESLSNDHIIPLRNISLSNMTLCTKEVLFSDKYLQTNVSELEQGVLYRCTRHNGVLYDALLMVNNTVYVFQSSNLAPRAHSLDYITIKNVMDKLQFNNTNNAQYNMSYVYCSDNSSKSKSRCNVTNASKHPLSEVEKALIDSKFTIYIARVCYYPDKTEILI